MIKEVSAISTSSTYYLLSNIATTVHALFLLCITIIKFVKINTPI